MASYLQKQPEYYRNTTMYKMFEKFYEKCPEKPVTVAVMDFFNSFESLDELDRILDKLEARHNKRSRLHKEFRNLIENIYWWFKSI